MEHHEAIQQKKKLDPGGGYTPSNQNPEQISCRTETCISCRQDMEWFWISVHLQWGTVINRMEAESGFHLYPIKVITVKPDKRFPGILTEFLRDVIEIEILSQQIRSR
jgi:hypothetical protein